MSTLEFKSPVSMLKHWAETAADRVYLQEPHNREVRDVTWGEVWDTTRRIAAGLQALGLQPGDRVSIISKNSVEWFLADFAIQAAGMISAPVYPTASADTIQYVLEHSAAKAVFLGPLDNAASVSSGLVDGLPTIGLPGCPLDTDHQWDSLLSGNATLADVSEPGPDDIFTIVYTSGSTGRPKGVEVTYRALHYGAYMPAKHLDVTDQDRMLSYLPLAHMYERTCIEHASIYFGGTVYFVENLETFAEDIRRVKPTYFHSIPRIWMKFKSGVEASVPPAAMAQMLQDPAQAAALSGKIKAQLGLDEARVCTSGSAPISTAILDWFADIGINISEGWGMTETGGASTVNYPFRRDKIGTIGNALPGTEIKISDEGEILIRGPGLFKGYHKNPEATAKDLRDGWLHTGDKADMDGEGYLRITGRVKDLFKTGKGKYVAPVPIESLLVANALIEQVCVLGSGLPQPVAMAVLSAETTRNLTEDDIRVSLAETLEKTNTSIEKHEQMDSIIVVKDVWSIENDFLTPTMKIKRHHIEKRYEPLLQDARQEPIVFL